MNETQKSIAATLSPREGWEPWRETFREHGEDALPEWRDGALSPLSPLDSDAPPPVFQLAPPRFVGSRKFWRSIECSATALRRALFGAIFATSAPRGEKNGRPLDHGLL
jgi:hypothetical protein